MNEQIFKPVENFVNDFKNHFINTFTSGELSKYMDKENMYNSIFNLDIMNNGIYLSHSLEG